MGQCHYRLHRHGVEDGGGDVLAPDVPGHQVLDVGLAEDAASRGNGIDLRAPCGQAVQVGHVHAQDDGHLVDERAGASRTIAVHAQVFGLAVLEEYHLGVFAPDVYH